MNKFTKLSERKYKVSRDLRGSNQHVRIIKVRRTPRIRAFMVVGLLLAILFYVYAIPAYNNFANSFAPKVIISPLAQAEAEEMPTPTPTVVIDNSDEQADIEAYMKTIFGSDFKVARAISHNECNPANANYPACELKSEVEHSIGLFQINLYNANQWIHAGRIPGKTMTEKVKWLKDPYNNTLYAYWVFKTSGWNPWSAYTSGNYLRSL